jgi:F-type H+-transporting ATPase subunit delta
MRDEIVSRIYAEALLKEAKKQKCVEALADDIRSFQPILQEKQALRRFFSGPQFSNDQKLELLQKIMENKVQPLLFQLTFILLKRRRMDHIDEICALYLDLVDKDLGIQEAVVTTAVQLPEHLSEKLRLKLERMTGTKIRIRNKVEPQIIGGLIVTMGNSVIDSSYKSRLASIRDQLLAVKVY